MRVDQRIDARQVGIRGDANAGTRRPPRPRVAQQHVQVDRLADEAAVRPDRDELAGARVVRVRDAPRQPEVLRAQALLQVLQHRLEQPLGAVRAVHAGEAHLRGRDDEFTDARGDAADVHEADDAAIGLDHHRVRRAADHAVQREEVGGPIDTDANDAGQREGPRQRQQRRVVRGRREPDGHRLDCRNLTSARHAVRVSTRPTISSSSPRA